MAIAENLQLSTLIEPGTWSIDSSHTTVGFAARHLMVTKVRGRFGAVEGTLTVGENPLDSAVEAVIQTASVQTNDDKRDEHLRSADFFDVENHPTMSFRSTGVKEHRGNYLLSGDLTIKGITRPVELDLEFEGVSADPWGGTRAGFTARTTVNRKDWGLEWNAALETGGVVVSDQITLELDVEVIKQN